MTCQNVSSKYFQDDNDDHARCRADQAKCVSAVQDSLRDLPGAPDHGFLDWNRADLRCIGMERYDIDLEKKRVTITGKSMCRLLPTASDRSRSLAQHPRLSS
jgi:hypothetical protein